MNLMSQIISLNPATLEELGRVDITPPQKVKEYASKAKAALISWSRLSYKERAGYILEARNHLLNHIDDFALTITRDNGKPVIEAITHEIWPILDLMSWAAHKTEKILSPSGIPTGKWGLLLRSSYISHQPLGVIGIISPWNYPFSIPVGSAVLALMAGNAVLLKTSSATPIVGQKIEEMFKGLPDFVFTHIPGDASTGEALLDSAIDKVVFTGSTATGSRVMELLSKRAIPCVAELGGKDAMIVRHDADLEYAAEGAVWGAFTNAGQCCASVERLYVHETIARRFIDLVAEKTRRLRQGSGEDPEVDTGPMTTQYQLQIVERHVEDARGRGARIITGGERNKTLPGWFYKPTVITGVDHSFLCVTEETFGPTLPIMSFADDDQAVKLANDSPFGLSASIWTRDIKLAKEMASKLRVGTVTINECIYTHAIPSLPWGGIKASGFGRTHGAQGLFELVNTQHTHMNRITRFKDLWWYPYSRGRLNLFRRLARWLRMS